MSIKKQYLKSKTLCKVTFTLDKKAASTAKEVFLVGEFNNWDKKATPMKKLKNSSFLVSVDIEKGKEYQFRYLIDGKEWENDWAADKYVPSDFGDCENSVVVV